MARKKEIKTGFHLKYIPAGRLKDLEDLAHGFPFIKDKMVAFTKYVETLSSIIERCWNSEKEFVGVSQRIMKKKLGIESAAVSKILKDLIKGNFIVKDAKDFKVGEVAWKYKAVYTELDQIVFSRNCFNKKTDSMMEEITLENLSKELQSYFKSLIKIKFNNSIHKYINKYSNDNTLLYCNSFVPECNSFVQPAFQSKIPYKVTDKIPTELISVFKLLAGKYRISRPIKDSRVYTNITNLPREYRPFLMMNDTHLIGFDIANSQPLIAAAAFRIFSMKEYGFIKDDVGEYQKLCEAGKFYEYFMEKNSIDTSDENLRSEFKGEFFGKIFYTKEVEQENYLKTQFKEKYPTCYEAIFRIKGDRFYSQDYKQFPALMTEIETEIIWKTNLEIIEQGFDMVNIFDSLYSDSEEAIQLAKKLVIEKFQLFGIAPKLKDIDYRNHVEIPSLPDLQAKIIPVLINESPVNIETLKGKGIENAKIIKLPIKNENKMELKDNYTPSAVINISTQPMTPEQEAEAIKNRARRKFLGAHAGFFAQGTLELLDQFEAEYSGQLETEKNKKLNEKK